MRLPKPTYPAGFGNEACVDCEHVRTDHREHKCLNCDCACYVEPETLRDRLAMAALTGLVTVPGMLPDAHARGAYQVADAMLAARKAKP